MMAPPSPGCGPAATRPGSFRPTSGNIRGGALRWRSPSPDPARAPAVAADATTIQETDSEGVRGGRLIIPVVVGVPIAIGGSVLVVNVLSSHGNGSPSTSSTYNYGSR